MIEFLGLFFFDVKRLRVLYGVLVMRGNVSRKV